MNVTVNPVNDAPVAANDAVVTPEDQAININVRANDTDVDSSVTVSGFSQGSHGSVALKAGGILAYTPTANYRSGSDTSPTRSPTGKSSSTASVSDQP